MSDPHAIDRREFARGSAMALLGGIAVTVSACGGSGGANPTAATPPAADPPPADPPTSDGDGRHGVVSDNHGHEAVVTAAEFASATTVMLDIQGEADHNHVLELSVAELDRIHQGTQVSKTSTDTFDHRHEVTFAAATPMPDDY